MNTSRLKRSISAAATATLLGWAAGLPAALAQEQPDAQDHADADEGEDVIVVQATRSGHRVQDEPIRVEVIDQEEIEEKLLMTPGNIAMLVNETGGVRVQVTSPALGAANVRMQGMRGRYTQLLADGLPLYGGQSIGILQIPPTDLGQVEIIKGAASALYGPSALGGVINLVSRRPGNGAQAVLLLNATSRDGQDVTAYEASPLGGDWSQSLVGGLHRQTSHDLDGDGWLDIPGYERWTVRPRLFWDAASGANAYFTFGAMGEDREGGTLPGRNAPDGQPFPNTLDSRRYDAGVVAAFPMGDARTLHLRGSGMTQDHAHQFGSVREDDTHETGFVEASFSGADGGTAWLVGAAVQADGFKSKTFSAFDYTYTTPALFAQVEQELGEELTLAGSARVDDHSQYGTHFSPRLSLLYRPGPFRIRASMGQGFYAPTPFVEEIEAAGLSQLEPLAGLKAETAKTGSLDVGYTDGPIELGVTLFASDIDKAVQLQDVDADTVRLINANGTTRTRGAEFLARYRWDAFTITGSYVHVDASEPDPSGAGRRAVPVTPRNTAGLVAMWEEHGVGRIGLEAYYSGKQQLEDNPYRSESKPYFELGFLGEMVIGNTSLFVNAENLLNIRQTKYDSLLRSIRAPDGRWTVDAWAPLDGFTVNVGLRIKFGGE